MAHILQYFRQSYNYYLAYYVGFFKHGDNIHSQKSTLHFEKDKFVSWYINLTKFSHEVKTRHNMILFISTTDIYFRKAD